MDVKSLINYQAMEKSMITYFHTGDAEERGTFENLGVVMESIWGYRQEILKNERKIKNAAYEWNQQVIWNPNRQKEIPAYRNKQEYIEELKAENICYREELIEEEKTLAAYKANFNQYMDGTPYDWENEIRKCRYWNRILALMKQLLQVQEEENVYEPEN